MGLKYVAIPYECHHVLGEISLKLQFLDRLLARAAMIMGMWLPCWCVFVVGGAYYSDGQLTMFWLQTKILC